MAVVFDKKDVIGYVTVKCAPNADPIKVHIYGGNCLAVFVLTHEGVDDLFWFFADVKHANNMLKYDKSAFPFTVVDCSINYSHRSAHSLVKIFTKSCIPVLCY